MRFSVVIPAYNRRAQLAQAIKSVLNQTHKGEVEIIVVDDGSNDGTGGGINSTEQYDHAHGRVLYIRHEKNLGKTFARNTGLRAATGDFVCELDSDDEYHSHYLETFDRLINENPDTHVFSCGAAVFNHKTGSFHTRPAFTPQAGEVFRSGLIGTGSFVYRRSLAPFIPESAHAYGSDDSFSALVQKQYPDIRALYGQNEEGQWLPLGDPYGDDYAKVFALTRENSVVGTPLPLYLQNRRP